MPKTPISARVDQGILDRAKTVADKENRSFNNLLETALKEYNAKHENLVLLKKYMLHVIESEGASFIEDLERSLSSVVFTKAEKELLTSIYQEVMKDC